MTILARLTLCSAVLVSSECLAEDTSNEELTQINNVVSGLRDPEAIPLGLAMKHMLYVLPSEAQVSLNSSDRAALRAMAEHSQNLNRDAAKAQYLANRSECVSFKDDIDSSPPQVGEIAQTLFTAQNVYYDYLTAQFENLLDRLTPSGRTSVLNYVRNDRVPKLNWTIADYPAMAKQQPDAFANWLRQTVCNETHHNEILAKLSKPTEPQNRTPESVGEDSLLMGVSF